MSFEKYVYLKAGKLVLHIENDGFRYRRHGTETIEWEASLEDLQEYPHLMADADTLLKHREAGVLNHDPSVRR